MSKLQDIHWIKRSLLPVAFTEYRTNRCLSLKCFWINKKGSWLLDLKYRWWSRRTLCHALNLSLNTFSDDGIICCVTQATLFAMRVCYLFRLKGVISLKVLLADVLKWYGYYFYKLADLFSIVFLYFSSNENKQSLKRPNNK